MNDDYILPTTKLHSTFAEAKHSLEGEGGFWWQDSELPTGFAALAALQRTLIVGEPGVGKSELMRQLKKHLDAVGVAAHLVELREPDAMENVGAFLAEHPRGKRAILLDALDEVRARDIPELIRGVEELVQHHPEIAIFLSGRWVFVSRHASQFPEYKILTIAPFTNAQVRAYLIAAGRSGAEVDLLLKRMTSFGHSKLVVQIPRYLAYLVNYLKEQGVQAASRVSRNELFEHFIYAKLKLENAKQFADKHALTKRMLEKLALTMEIYQTNLISQDDLMTFFDDVTSDLKHMAVAQIGIEGLYDYSILKVSREDRDKIEFDNAEFQEYLAAKEITRFPEPARAAFAIATDPQLHEIYPSWYNTLTFLVDLDPGILEQLIEFSGLRAPKFRVLDEAFINFLSRLDERRIPQALRASLFRDLMSYHERTLQWLPYGLGDLLASLSDPSTDGFLKNSAVHAESLTGSNREVHLANIAYAVGFLMRAGKPVDHAFWRERLIAYARDPGGNGVLVRHALTAVAFLQDPAVIDALPPLSNLDQLARRELIDACIELAPEHARSVEYFIEAIRSNEMHGRYGLYSLRSPRPIRQYLAAFLQDRDFRREFMDDVPIFRDDDRRLVDNIAAVLDDDSREVATQVLALGLKHELADQSEQSLFMKGLWKLLRKENDGFVADMVRRMAANNAAKAYSAERFIAEVLDLKDVERYIEAMDSLGERSLAHYVMVIAKSSDRPDALAIYERGRPVMSKEYEAWEQAQQARQVATTDTPRVLARFRSLLEPQPGQYDLSVFRYYTQNADALESLLTPADRARFGELLRGTALKFDLSKVGATISATDSSKTITTNRAVGIFATALTAARRFGVDLKPYRAQMVSFIPFADGEELQAVFDEIQALGASELSGVIEVYQRRHSDLWQLNPTSFVRVIERYRVVDAVPVLRAFVEESGWEAEARRMALEVADSLAPNAAFLREVFDRYEAHSSGIESDLATLANGLLITSHRSETAILWRLEEVRRRAGPLRRLKDGRVHRVTPFDEEVTGGKSFAKPLMELTYPGYEAKYLVLLDEALALWIQGPEFYDYAQYLWGIVFAYVENLKEQGSYDPLQKLESKIAGMEGREGANWLATRLSRLRRVYISYLGRPATFAKAVAKYNDARRYNSREIHNSSDLHHHVLSALDVEVRRWIEYEGAYEVLRFEVNQGRQQYEKLIQKTMKAQVENALIRRGFQVDASREPQLLDEKRIDFLIRYGFAGPIALELKLTSNKDLQGRKLKESASFASMKRYMRGYGAAHGILWSSTMPGRRICLRLAGCSGASRACLFCTSIASHSDPRPPPRAYGHEVTGASGQKKCCLTAEHESL